MNTQRDSLRLASVVLISLIGCATSAQPLRVQANSVEAIWLCREHLSLRNHGTSDREVRVELGSGSSRQIAVRGRAPDSVYGYAATIVVVADSSNSSTVAVEGLAPIRVARPTASCIRDLPTLNPDSIVTDYTRLSADARERHPDRPWIAGVMIVQFLSSAPREQVNALIRTHGLTLIGGMRGDSLSTDIWGFWIEDRSDNLRTLEAIKELRRSPIVQRALPFVTME